MSQGNARWGIGATGPAGADGATGPPGPVGPPGAGASGAKLFELAPIASPRFLGRSTPGSGTIEELMTPTAVGMLPVFSLVAKGLVPAPGAAPVGAFLRDDSTWAVPAGGTVSGITLSQLGDLSPLKVLGRFTAGSGAPEQLRGDQIASMIGKFAGTGLALVPTPTGGALGKMLRDDGVWVTPSFVASGVTLSQQGDLSPLRIVGRSTLGSGSPEQLTQGQVASMLPVFSATGTPGLVPQPSAAGSGMFLRDDGKWASPTGLGNGQFALMPPSTIKGTTGETGIPQDLVGSGVATLLPLFNNIDKGLVPGSAGGTSAFLRADGVWAAPSVAAGVSGVAFSQINDISAPRFLGRLAGSGSIQELTPLSAASMLPRMLGSGFGLVVAPTGGTAGAFLRDDGLWATVTGGGGGPTMLAAGPAGAVQYNAGSGFGGLQEFTVGTGLARLSIPLEMPTGIIRLGTGAPSGGLINFANNQTALRFAGFGSGPAADYQGLKLDSTDRLSIGDGNVVETLNDVSPSGGYYWSHGVGGSKVRVAGLSRQQFGLGPGLRLGLPQLAHIATDDKIGAWTPSGFANVATGIQSISSGTTLQVGGSVGAQITASGFGFGGVAGIGNAQLSVLAPLAIHGRFTAGSGAVENLNPGQVASLIPPFFASGLRGIVISPTGGTSGKYLQDDGSWTTPSAGGATGVGNDQMIMMPPFTLKGRNTTGSGIPENLTRLQVASMLPLFTASGGTPGLVSAPTGGGPSGMYLNDSGTWDTPNLKAEVTVTSGTIDWNAAPFYRVAPITGPLTFTFTPPPVHRHVQLRTANGSGYKYTFPSLVRWPNGGSVPTGTDTASGLHVFNFFWHGSGYDGMGAVGYK